MRLMNHRNKRILSNDFQIERIKILVQFLLMLLASLVAGGIFTEFLNAELFLSLSQRVSIITAVIVPLLKALCGSFCGLHGDW